MSGDRSFSRREIAAAVTFLTLGTVIAVSSYHAGVRMSGHSGGAEMTAVSSKPVVNGQSLFAGNCAGCHGAQGQGGVGPALGESKAWTPAAFGEAVLHGKHPSGRELAPVMPRFAETGLDGAPPTDEQVEAIHTYLKGL